MFTIIVALIVIGILIFVHELGHFLIAKKLGIKVEIFSLGFGPKIFSFKKGETEYRICALPLGGYVKLYGERSEPEEFIEEPEKAFALRKPWEKALVVLGGPFANFIFAILVFWGIFSFVGIYYIPPIVGEVLPNSPAEKAGLQKGDRILEINGKKIKDFQELVLILREEYKEGFITLKIKRDDKIFTIKVKPEIREEHSVFGKIKVPIIGIKSKPEIVHEQIDPFTALLKGIEKTWDFIALTFKAIFKLLTGELPFSTLGGPLTIGKMAGDTAKMGIIPLLYFTALLSINLGVINIIPFPMLDGGYLVLYSIEAIRKKPVPYKIQEMVFKIGFVLLIILAIAVFYNDIIRIFRLKF